MTFLLDTSIVIHYLRREQRIIGDLRSRRSEGLAISAISVGELYEGIFLSPNPAESERGLNDFLREGDILVVNREIGIIFGQERARLRRAGRPMGDLDLLIASTALHYGLPLLTLDSDFQRVEGLQTIFL